MHQLSLLFIIVVISGALCTVQDFVIMSKCARNKAIHIAHDGKVSVTDIPMTQNITIAGLFSTVSEEDFKLTLFAKETQMYLCFNNHWRLVGMKKLQERCYFKEAIKYGYFEYHSFVDVKRRIGFTHRGKPVGPRKNVEDECYSFTRVEGKKFFSTQPTSASLIAATSSAGSHNSHKNRNHNNNNNNNNNGHSNSYSNSGSNNSRNRNNSNNSNNINNINNNNNNLISANKHNNAHQHRVRHHHNDPNMVAKRQSHATGRRVNNNNNNSNNNNSNNKRKLCNRSNLLNTNQTTAAALTTQVAVVDKDSVVTPVVRKQRKIKIKCGNRGQRARFLNPKDPEHRRIVFGQQQLEQQQLQQLQLQSTQSSSTQQQLDYNTQDLSSTSPTFQDSYTTSNGESGSGSFSSIPDEYSNDDASAILPDLPNSLDSSTEYLNDSNSYSSDKQINTTNIYLNSDDTDNINSNSNINTVTVTIAVTLTSNDLSTNISKNSTNNVSSDVNVTNINKNYNNNNNNNYYNNNNNNNNNSNYNKRINDNSMLDSQTTTATAASSSSSSSLSSSSPSISSFSSASSLSSTSSSSSSTTTTTTTTLKKYYKKSKPIIISASFQSTVGDQRGPSSILGIGLRDLKVNDNNLTPTNNLDKTTKTSYNDKTLPLRRKLTTVGS